MAKKVKDLDPKTLLSDVKVTLSDDLYKNSSLYPDKPREVYLVGYLMGDFFVRINKGDSQIHPLFRFNIDSKELEELEVVEEN